ncbi:MAG: 50S ribosomal protein L23 [Candidatus Latescibacteria bacterium]|nr:50S ribosomal protein L23 [Candidatus Latescibacterota bacterium]MCK5327950.1 50S ribosomal protein L23 [Candidatus Latescibacterota bacterium]MCK5380412.1 50S ribosomal protein L23 [Candidatus Latescibacterota bacterium]MCK5525526.1 50S ribosomal protein L23 [Candidatus Latescibacterota bacterium]MCK5733095.1 50S ribosomal protein L23 [Candidatus Latescibacterota bacterium]
MKDIRRIIRRPLITEKANALREAHNQYCFEVDRSANKIEIKGAVEELFEVHVTDVRTATIHGKVKRMGRFQGKRPDWKKAMVTLRAGDSIELYEGV